MAKSTPPQPTRDLESSHKYNKYDFKEHGERSEHLQFEYNCRNVLLDCSLYGHWDFLHVGARLQALEASTSKDPIPPSTLTPPSIPVKAPSPPPIFVGDISIMIFDS
jgi:hypothetical protein